MIDVLFVCSGNTCRSPMAECLFNAECARRGLDLRAASAGVMAHAGEPASDGAFAAMKERGLDLSRHQARTLREGLADQPRRIVCMSEAHARAVRALAPTAEIIALQPPVSDPFGGSLAVYRQTANELAQRAAELAERLSGTKSYKRSTSEPTNKERESVGKQRIRRISRRRGGEIFPLSEIPF